jgi:hypothetical protein
MKPTSWSEKTRQDANGRRILGFARERTPLGDTVANGTDYALRRL